MSAATPRPAATAPSQGPSPMTRVAAVAVVIALAGLAYYAVFAGPTTVAVKAPATVSPAKSAPAPAEPAGEERESGRGD